MAIEIGMHGTWEVDVKVDDKGGSVEVEAEMDNIVRGNANV